jgi:uncharacterized repeat protein (TIGR02543 family)
MRNEIKKKLALLLSALIIFMGLPVTSFAVEEFASISDFIGTPTSATTGHFDWDFNIESPFVLDTVSATLNGAAQAIDINSGKLNLTGLTPSTLYTLAINANYHKTESQKFDVIKITNTETIVTPYSENSVKLISKVLTGGSWQTNPRVYYLVKHGDYYDTPLLALQAKYPNATSIVLGTVTEIENSGWDYNVDISTVNYNIITTNTIVKYQVVGLPDMYNSYNDAKNSVLSTLSYTPSSVVDDSEFINNVKGFTIYHDIPYVAPGSASFTTLSHSTYEVIFITNGGSEISKIDLTSPLATFTMPTNPTKTGFSFAGWYTDAGLINEYTGDGSVTYAEPYGGTYTMTLYAKWTPASTYEVIFNTNGGSPIGTIGLVYPTDTFTMPTEPTKTGFSFAGWYTDESLTVPYSGGGLVTYTENYGGTYTMTLYAKWSTIPLSTFTINFDSKGGSTVSPIVLIYPNTVFNMPVNPTRSGFTFAGWFYNIEGEQAFTASFDVGYVNPYETHSSVDVYAKWTEIEQPTTEVPTTSEPTTAAPTTEEPPTEPPTIGTTESSTEELPTEPVPLGPATVVNFDEPLDSSIFEELVELETEETPLADALPQTGQLPVELFYGIGGLITAAGVFLKKK